MFQKILIAFAFIGTACACFASDIRLTLSLDKVSYKPGDLWKASANYLNVSSHKVRIIPDLPTYQASRFVMTSIATGAHPRIILPGPPPSFDFKSIARGAQLLQAGESTSRLIEAEVSATLPGYYGIPERGIYLVFGGHALKLPDFGKYRIQALIDSRPGGVEAQYASELFGPPALWTGKIRSAPTVIEFNPR